MKSYVEKLRDPRWQKKRLEVFERDEFRCQMCQDSCSELHVHHRIYLKKVAPWEYEDSAYVTLCKDCHKRITDLMIKLQSQMHFEPFLAVMEQCFDIMCCPDGWLDFSTMVSKIHDKLYDNSTTDKTHDGRG